MNTTALKIILDTNILIAIIAQSSPFRWIFDCVVEGKIILCVLNEILFEYQEVLTAKTSVAVAENIINFLTVNPFTEKTEIFFNFSLIKDDPDDNKFVDCAIASNAVCLISNDRHFQILQTIDFPKVFILSLSEFEAKYKSKLTVN